MDYDIGMGIATFKKVLLLHVVIQTLIYYILTEILSKVLIQYQGVYKSHALAWDLPLSFINPVVRKFHCVLVLYSSHSRIHSRFHSEFHSRFQGLDTPD